MISVRPTQYVPLFVNCRCCGNAIVEQADRLRGTCVPCASTEPDEKQSGRALVLEAYRADPLASLSQLAAKTGFTVPTVRHHMIKLEAEGMVVRNTSRSPKRRTPPAKEKDLILEERIDRIVARAKRQESGDPGYDVIRHINRPLNMRSGGKLG